MFIIAERAPAACGVNVTEMMHLALLATLESQVFVWGEIAGIASANVMSVMVSDL